MNIFDSKKRVVSPLIDLRKETNDHPQNLNKKEVLEKIDKYRERINKDQFILIIKLCLFIIITGILIIYILNMILQRRSINMTEKILLTYYYNAETKNIILNIFSKLLKRSKNFSSDFLLNKYSYFIILIFFSDLENFIGLFLV